MFYFELQYFDCGWFLSFGSAVFRDFDGSNRQIDQQTLTEKKVLLGFYCPCLC